MNKDTFWIFAVFLISVSISLFIKTQNYLFSIVVVVACIAFLGFRFKTIFLDNKNQDNYISQIKDKIDLAIFILTLFFFSLSILFSKYEMQFFLTAAIFVLAGVIKKGKNKKN